MVIFMEPHSREYMYIAPHGHRTGGDCIGLCTQPDRYALSTHMHVYN